MAANLEAGAGWRPNAETRAMARRARLHRWVRKLHAWIGAWGAIAAVIFGLSGFVQNHRGLMKLPQGGVAVMSSVELAVPAAARASPELLRDWLRQSQGLAFEVRPVRGPGAGSAAGPGGGRGEGRGQGGSEGRRESRSEGREQGRSEGHGQGRDGASPWLFNAGGARTTYQAEYRSGDDALTLRTSVQSPLAVLIRLHKAVGGGVAWVLLSDSFALAMAALGVSGLIMWSRGRSPRQMAFSILGAAVVVLGVIVGSAV